jgi:hypothetical protein
MRGACLYVLEDPKTGDQLFLGLIRWSDEKRYYPRSRIAMSRIKDLIVTGEVPKLRLLAFSSDIHQMICLRQSMKAKNWRDTLKKRRSSSNDLRQKREKSTP